MPNRRERKVDWDTALVLSLLAMMLGVVGMIIYVAAPMSLYFLGAISTIVIFFRNFGGLLIYWRKDD
jgi:hypothetical protein